MRTLTSLPRRSRAGVGNVEAGRGKGGRVGEMHRVFGILVDARPSAEIFAAQFARGRRPVRRADGSANDEEMRSTTPLYRSPRNTRPPRPAHAHREWDTSAQPNWRHRNALDQSRARRVDSTCADHHIASAEPRPSPITRMSRFAVHRIANVQALEPQSRPWSHSAPNMVLKSSPYPVHLLSSGSRRSARLGLASSVPPNTPILPWINRTPRCSWRPHRYRPLSTHVDMAVLTGSPCVPGRPAPHCCLERPSLFCLLDLGPEP